MSNHVCGFVIANARNHQRRLAMRSMWDGQADKLMCEDLQAGKFTGSRQAWKTLANARRLVNIIGSCPFTDKMMRDKGWNLEAPSTAESQRPTA